MFPIKTSHDKIAGEYKRQLSCYSSRYFKIELTISIIIDNDGWYSTFGVTFQNKLKKEDNTVLTTQNLTQAIAQYNKHCNTIVETLKKWEKEALL